MKERVLRFGVERGLSGVLGQPAAEAAVNGAPGVVLLNSGILHHVGPSRLYVRMARRLTLDGHITFRFDYSGIGDSQPRKDSMPFVDSAPVETSAALDLLQKKFGIDEFWLIGLCSGADMAFKVAGLDERVTGMVQLDPYAYRTKGYYVHRYGPKLLSLKAYVHSIKARLRTPEPETPAPTEGEAEAEVDESYTPPEYRRIFPPREQVEEQLRVLIDRRVRMLNIFSDGQLEHINHGAQYARAFPSLNFADLLTVEYFGKAAHTFTDLQDQQDVEELVARWAAEGREQVVKPERAVA